MPLQPGRHQETISENIEDMLESPTFNPDKTRKKRRQMAIAASLRKSREGGETLSRAAFRPKK